MYRAYVKEKENLETIDTEQGFVAYSINKISKVMDIGDSFIKPEYRNGFQSMKLFKRAEDLAIKEGCKKITCCVVTFFNKPENSLYVVLRCGFKFSHIYNGVIYFYKNI